MSDTELQGKKKRLAQLIKQCKQFKNRMYLAPKEVKIMAKIVTKVAKDLNIKENQVIAETIIDVKCVASALPKTKFKTLKEASADTGKGAYPCKHCDYWHRTSGDTKFMYSMFECPGCNLPYHKKGGKKFCSVGCHNAYQIRKVKEALKNVIKARHS